MNPASLVSISSLLRERIQFLLTQIAFPQKDERFHSRKLLPLLRNQDGKLVNWIVPLKHGKSFAIINSPPCSGKRFLIERMCRLLARSALGDLKLFRKTPSEASFPIVLSPGQILASGLGGAVEKSVLTPELSREDVGVKYVLDHFFEKNFWLIIPDVDRCRSNLIPLMKELAKIPRDGCRLILSSADSLGCRPSYAPLDKYSVVTLSRDQQFEFIKERFSKDKLKRTELRQMIEATAGQLCGQLPWEWSYQSFVRAVGEAAERNGVNADPSLVVEVLFKSGLVHFTVRNPMRIVFVDDLLFLAMAIEYYAEW